ncbi:MAG: TlyA family RNA methyltransferase [Alphaproteobacteria bacterium]|nr:TlyA family RNA methyltransferase [Alphaproteobacteria bacterium]
MTLIKPKKIRADQLLVDRGLAETRSKASAFILAGKVFSGDKKINKPGDFLLPDSLLELKDKDHPWVSRGGIKLAHALKIFNFTATNKICLDLGASTGGFTDVLLTHGAKKIYAVDVGYGQLAWKLRDNPRVIIMEKTNARYLQSKNFSEKIDLITCDASFIGLRTILPASLHLVGNEAWLIALIKPQFEVGKKDLGKGGIVTDPVLHQKVCDTIWKWVEEQGWNVMDIIESPILGAEGNKEFLLGAYKNR